MRTSVLGNQEGAALIESVLVLPVLLLLVFGIMDVSQYLWRLNMAGKAVQLGVRQAIVSDAVAVGPGLTPAESASYWDGLPLGARCRDRAQRPNLCPTFSVSCETTRGCACTGGSRCGFAFVRPNLAPILARMQAALPELRPEHLRIAYATNELGYVGRPVPVPVDVTVSIVGLRYEFGALGTFLGSSLPLAASATLPGESLLTP